MPARTLRDLPRPNSLPIIGNLLDLDLKKLHRVLERWADEHGDFYTFELGSKKVLVISDAEAVQTVLKQRPKVFRRLGTIEPVFQEMGITGVFSAESEDWKRQRRLTAHALDAGHLRQFFPTMIKVTERLRNRWLRAAEAGAEVDVQQDLMRYTVDITTNLAFGYDMNTLEKEGDIIQEHLEKIFPAINRRVNAAFPYWRYFKLPIDRELEKALAQIRETINGFITRARARLAENPDLAAHPTNALEAMLAARDEGDAAFSDEEIYGNALTLLLAGEDTTANTLAWMTHFMIENPGMQRRMRREALDTAGPSGLLNDLKDAEQLEYIEAVMHETMRLKPVAPLLFMEALEDTEIAGLAIPKGMPIFLVTMYSALRDEHFGDADEFRPERWIEAKTNPTGCPHNARAFVPFGAGPRFCPGRQLALAEIKTVMAMVCANFEIEKAKNPQPVSELFSFAMMPQGLRVRFKTATPSVPPPSSRESTLQT